MAIKRIQLHKNLRVLFQSISHRHPIGVDTHARNQSHYQSTLQSSLIKSHEIFTKPIIRSISIQSSPNLDNERSDNPKSPKLPWRSMTSISLVTLSIGYLIGVTCPPGPIGQLIINSAFKPAPITQSPNSLDLNSDPITSVIEDQLHQLSIVKELELQTDSWSSFRPFRHVDPRKLAHSLTYSTLRGPGKFAIPPLIFINRKKTEAVIVIHVGDVMCGHDGIVHGGLLATICDEGLAALAFSNLPNHMGVTASLKLDYKKPVLANQFIILRSWIPQDRPPKGRKVWSNGRIESLSGDVLVEAESLFIEPKLAKLISNSQIRDYIKATAQ